MENPANKKMKGPLRPELLERSETEPAGLSRFILGISHSLSAQEIEGFVAPEIDWVYDAVYEQLNLVFRSWLYGEEMAKQEVSYPAGWWQAFKFRWFPGLRLPWKLKQGMQLKP